jgi:hypothetical protein
VRPAQRTPQSWPLPLALACNQVWRMSLEEGRFMSPLVTRSPATNAAGEWAGRNARVGLCNQLQPPAADL